MPDRRDPSPDPRPALVVETEIKPDGRKIHYYEWPDQPAEPVKKAPPRTTRSSRRRV